MQNNHVDKTSAKTSRSRWLRLGRPLPRDENEALYFQQNPTSVMLRRDSRVYDELWLYMTIEYRLFQRLQKTLLNSGRRLCHNLHGPVQNNYVFETSVMKSWSRWFRPGRKNRLSPVWWERAASFPTNSCFGDAAAKIHKKWSDDSVVSAFTKIMHIRKNNLKYNYAEKGTCHRLYEAAATSAHMRSNTWRATRRLYKQHCCMGNFAWR